MDLADRDWSSIQELDRPSTGRPSSPRGSRRPGAAIASADHGQDVFLAHQQDFLVAVELEFLAGVGGEQDVLADLDLQLAALAVLGDPPVADGHDFALLRLVLGRIRQDDPASRRLLGLFSLHHHTIAQRFECHRPGLLSVSLDPRKTLCDTGYPPDHSHGSQSRRVPSPATARTMALPYARHVPSKSVILIAYRYNDLRHANLAKAGIESCRSRQSVASGSAISADWIRRTEVRVECSHRTRDGSRGIVSRTAPDPHRQVRPLKEIVDPIVAAPTIPDDGRVVREGLHRFRSGMRASARVPEPARPHRPEALGARLVPHRGRPCRPPRESTRLRDLSSQGDHEGVVAPRNHRVSILPPDRHLSAQYETGAWGLTWWGAADILRDRSRSGRVLADHPTGQERPETRHKLPGQPSGVRLVVEMQDEEAPTGRPG